MNINEQRYEKPTHSYVVRYLTHDIIGYINRFEIDDTDMTIDEIANTSLIGSSKNDYPINIVSLEIDGKPVSKLELKSINDRLFGKLFSECDAGGAAAGGDAGGTASGDIGSDSTGNNGGIQIDDVLGKNEPGKGYMGPGNFYIPSKVKVPFKRWEVSNGGSKRKKTKGRKDKKYSYEKGMKVVVNMFESDDSQTKPNKRHIMSKLKNISKTVKSMADIERVNDDFERNKDAALSKLNDPKFKQQKNMLIEFGRFIKDVCTGKHKCSWFTITMIATALVYVLSPIDIIPDAIPIAGIIDDAYVIRLVYNVIKDEFDEWRSNRI